MPHEEEEKAAPRICGGALGHWNCKRITNDPAGHLILYVVLYQYLS